MGMMNDKEISYNDVVGRGYRRFWTDRHRYRVVKGGRASKKSTTTALWFIYNIMSHPLSNAVVVRKTFNTLKDSCFAQLKWAARRWGVYHLWKFTNSPLEATYLPTGQKILFRGFDDVFKLTSITVEVGFLCWVWLEEAYEIENEADFETLDESIRGEIPEEYKLWKQITITFNPWINTHWTKLRFFDQKDQNAFTLTTTYLCNEWLDDGDRAKIESLKITNPSRFKVVGLGDYGMPGGQYFEEFIDDSSHYEDRKGSHVITPFEVPENWRIYRSFDFGYAKPFSCGWWAQDYDGRLYRIFELYGCVKNKPNTGLKWTPEKIFHEIREVERNHRWLKGKNIIGVADPSIWDASRGKSIAQTAEEFNVFFEPGDNKRLPGWMQVRYRLAFDENGVPMMYIFNTCRDFCRTFPELIYHEHHVEDLDTDGEDHIADEVRYLCMMNPIAPKEPKAVMYKPYNPLDTQDYYNRYDYRKIGG